MQSHPASQPSSSPIWSFVNTVIAVLLAGFALFWGAVLFYGGIKQSQENRAKQAAAAAAAPAPAAPAPLPPPTPAAPVEAAPPPAPAPAATPPVPAAAAPATAGGPVQEVLLKPDPTQPFGYDQKSFTVKSGVTVRLTFENVSPIPQPHNWVLGKPGSKDKLIASSTTYATNPQAAGRGFVMDDPDIITATKLLQPTEKQTIEFVAGPPGEYPYLCTFPGHAMLMNGVMKVQ